MSVSKLCGSLCSVPRGSEVGGEQAVALGDWLSARSRRISLVRCSLAFAAMYAMAKAARIESFSTSTWSSSRCRLDLGWREPSVP